MSALPVCSGAEAIRAFERGGWIEARRHGSHVTLIKPGESLILTVPLHRELDRVATGLIRKASMTVEEFSRLLRA
jgi:predicted RNA binding protein YcfA (HicA-like mRNA interferase family)